MADDRTVPDGVNEMSPKTSPGPVPGAWVRAGACGMHAALPPRTGTSHGLIRAAASQADDSRGIHKPKAPGREPGR